MFCLRSILAIGLGGLSLAASLPGCSRLDGSAGIQSATAGGEQLPSAEELRTRIDRALAFTQSKRHMNQQTVAAWQVVHGILVYGRDLQIYHDGELGSALDYLLRGGALNGWNLRPAPHGVRSILEAGSKTGMGHPDQWLGYMSQCGLSPDEPLVVGGKQYKIADLLTQSQWDIYPGMEATWTLMAVSTYLPQDATWTASDGSQWTIDRIVDMESDADVNSAACGGSHRLYGLAVALNHYLEEGGKLEGAWLKADQKIKKAVATAKAYQQADGTFSTNYFVRPSTSVELASRLSTTGHTFEFLTMAMDEQQVREPWFTRSLVALLDLLERTYDMDLECGGLYHSVHGLQLYRARIFGPPDSPADAAAGQTAAAAQPPADKAPAPPAER